jgi:hypothetical protein
MFIGNFIILFKKRMSQGPETKGPQKAMYPFQKQTLLYLRTKKTKEEEEKVIYISTPH